MTTIDCFFCKTHFTTDIIPKFCPNCGSSFSSSKTNPQLRDNYELIKSIGKGGMGEVFLAFDKNCSRLIALKQIREDLQDHTPIHKRFLREAKITSQLTHPTIIPIYNIHEDKKIPFYTMPFVEGLTLKEIFKRAKKLTHKDDKIEQLTSSIPALVRIFLSVCQAIAYAHSKNILHRDIKPENIIVGKYGEVLILDWGLAKSIHFEEEDLKDIEPAKDVSAHITKIGKVVGTIAYMAPERADGAPASIQSDIYALGVILYQILTLKYPFHRGKTLTEFRKNLETEVLYDPSEVAPYRDVPKVLSTITLKTLKPDPKQRYRTVQELIQDVENYLEGRSEWFQITELNIEVKKDWEFQENVLIAEHIAITRSTETSDWVSLMISKESFQENTMIETEVCLGDNGEGIGFLLSIPEISEREHLNDGYCLWLSSEKIKSTKLLRSTVEVMNAPDTFLKKNQSYKVTIEKIDNNIYFYLDDILQFSYISYLPLVGTHIGLLARDADFTIKPIKVFVGSQSLKVNCLAVPDAFLAHKDFHMALSEYRRIGYSFPGTAEGREAMFRAGVTLLEQAKDTQDLEKQNQLYEEALEEFGKLHRTPGGPLEYLGKALVYQTLKEYDEEIKCFDLALRKYPKHPLLPILHEQILYRTLQSSRYHRKVTYQFSLLVSRHVHNLTETTNLQKLFNSIQKHWEVPYFIPLSYYENETPFFKNTLFSLLLAFWLNKPYVEKEIILENTKHLEFDKIFKLAVLLLSEMGAKQIAQITLTKVKLEKIPSILFLRLKDLYLETELEHILENEKNLDDLDIGILLTIMEQCVDQKLFKQLDIIYNYLRVQPLAQDQKIWLDYHMIWGLLYQKKVDLAQQIIQSYSLEVLHQESTPLHFLYGCWLLLTEGREIAFIHLFGLLDITFPRSWTLFGHNYSLDKDFNEKWVQRAFTWEKRQLFRQLALFYFCLNDFEKHEYYLDLKNNEKWHEEIYT
ncbi:Serine/threonine-protein kinase PknD [Candidatus Rubidus massiliensis]|nr:Serine/threonine-protein kinase PknD [Candidatus Rubidus massiliensis]